MQVVPILAQAPDVVRTYVEETGLPFNILIDASRDVLKAYGVWQAFSLTSWNIGRPALFLIDCQRTIRYSFISRRQDQFPSHEEIVDAIQRSGFTPDESASADTSPTP